MEDWKKSGEKKRVKYGKEGWRTGTEVKGVICTKMKKKRSAKENLIIKE